LDRTSEKVPKQSKFLFSCSGIRFSRGPDLEALRTDLSSPAPPKRSLPAGKEGDARSGENSIYRLNDDGLDLSTTEEGSGNFERLEFDGIAFTSEGPVVGEQLCNDIVHEVVSEGEGEGEGEVLALV
jgi:hypothetical protein